MGNRDQYFRQYRIDHADRILATRIKTYVKFLEKHGYTVTPPPAEPSKGRDQ